MKALIIFFLLLPLISYTQEQFNFSPEEPLTINEIKEYELSLNSKINGFSHFKPYFDENFEDMIPDVKPTALIFQRVTDEFIPNLATWYFFNEDSLVTGFFYSWAFYNPKFNPTENVELLKAQRSRLKEYQTKYRDVEQHLVELLGSPTNSKILSKSKKRYIEWTMWDNPDLRTVLVLDFSPELTTIPGTSFIGGGDSSIRVKTFYK